MDFFALVREERAWGNMMAKCRLNVSVRILLGSNQ